MKKHSQELPTRLAICSNPNFMNEAKVAFYNKVIPIEQRDLDKAIELAIDFCLVDKKNATEIGNYLGTLDNISSLYSPLGMDICGKVLQEACITLLNEIPIDVDLIRSHDIGVQSNGFASDFILSDVGKDALEEKIMDRIEEDGDIALSETTKRVLERMHIDINELRRRVREKLEDEKEQREEDEITEMAVAKKHRQRLNKLFE